MNSEIQLLKKEYEEVLEKIRKAGFVSDWEKIESLSRRKKKLQIIIRKEEELTNLLKEEKENRELLIAEKDLEMINLVQNELTIISQKTKILQVEINSLLEKLNQEEGEEEKSRAVIIEIRAGTGGDEAALFAKNLFQMYSRYAQKKGWSQKILNSHQTEIGGLKEIIFELKNGNVYSFLKHEGGVHRVQRIPETEKGGRIHTSTVSVIVMTKPKKSEIKILPGDLKIDICKSSGPGGQNVNKRETAVRITHLPTNITAASQNERSLAQNKENTMAILEAKIIKKMEEEASEKIKKERKNQVTSSERAEKIRTYNFPQSRVTDHRIQKRWSEIEKIMSGDLEDIIKSLQQELTQTSSNNT